MGKKHPSSQEWMRFVSCEFLKPLKQRNIDTARPELINQLVVVDRELPSVRRNGALDVPWGDDLLVREGRIGGFDGWCNTKDIGGTGLGSEGVDQPSNADTESVSLTKRLPSHPELQQANLRLDPLK